MSRVPSRTFCCCIPVRAGVILVSLLGLAGGGLVAAAGIISLKHHGHGHSHGNTHHDRKGKIVAIIQIVVYLLLALVSLFGLIGAITKRLGFIRTYLSALIVHLIFNLGMGVFAIHRNFKLAPKYYADCLLGPDGVPSKEASVINTCTNGTTLMKALMITVFVVVILLETWACFIVVNYSKQVVEEEREIMIKDTESW